MQKKNKNGQVSTEYLIIVGFVTFVVIAVIGIAFFYSGATKDRIKMTQVNNFANKIISTSESVFYAGEPSKSTISAYLPENVKDIEIDNYNLIIEFQTYSGLNVIGFPSKVNLSEGPNPLTTVPGIKKIEIRAEQNYVVINAA